MTGTNTLGFGSGLSHQSGRSYTPGLSHSNRSGMSGAIDVYGFDGQAANGMLAAGLTSSRSELLRDLMPASLGVAPDIVLSAMRTMEGPTLLAPPLKTSGGDPRAGLARFELLSSVEFHSDGSKASLKGRTPAGAFVIAEMTRPDLATLRGQLIEVQALANQRDDRMSEILTQVLPPLGYYASVAGLQAGRHPRTLELVDIAIEFAYSVEMRFKHALGCPRPHELSGAVQPMIEVPQHTSMPSGHATEGHVIAGVLAAVVPAIRSSLNARTYLRRLAWRIAYNRIVAGLHYPVDNFAGRMLGDALATYFLAMCQGGAWTSASFDATQAVPALNDSDAQQQSIEFGPSPLCSVATSAGAVVAPANPVLSLMFSAAQKEWEES